MSAALRPPPPGSPPFWKRFARCGASGALSPSPRHIPRTLRRKRRNRRTAAARRLGGHTGSGAEPGSSGRPVRLSRLAAAGGGSCPSRPPAVVSALLMRAGTKELGDCGDPETDGSAPRHPSHDGRRDDCRAARAPPPALHTAQCTVHTLPNHSICVGEPPHWHRPTSDGCAVVVH